MSKTRLASDQMDPMTVKEDKVGFLNVALGENCPSRMRTRRQMIISLMLSDSPQ